MGVELQRLARLRSLRLIPAIGAVVTLCAIVATVWFGHRLAEKTYINQSLNRAETALSLTQNALAAYLARYEVTPQLLADLDVLRQLFDHPKDAQDIAQINQLLALKNEAIQSSDVYIMGLDGMTLAASNHDRFDSFIGENFNYRPYFTQALAGGLSRFYALGTTSGVRGYYFSAPVRNLAGQIAGVIAVKIGVDQIENTWAGSEYIFYVTDPEGIIFLASDPGLLYKAVLPLSQERLARTRASRRYADARILALGQQMVSDKPLIQRLDGRDYISLSKEMPEAGWTVHVLADTAGVAQQSKITLLSLMGLALALGLGAVILLQRRQQARERLAFESRTKLELEQRVQERTVDLARLNQHLELEISEKRKAQANLLRLGKLATLGQISASLSHEINQPLAAARNYADSAGVFIDRGDLPRAKENISLILSLIDRMAAIGAHLRNAARNPKEKLAPAHLSELLRESEIILAGRLASARARFVIDLPQGLAPLLVGATRMQQVLVNLLSNAIDAVENIEDRRILITARDLGDRVEISIRDHGLGVSPAIEARIFDPFFTTKGLGAGLGLGLSISFNIIRDFAGEIKVQNANPGAEFLVTLPAAR